MDLNIFSRGAEPEPELEPLIILLGAGAGAGAEKYGWLRFRKRYKFSKFTTVK